MSVLSRPLALLHLAVIILAACASSARADVIGSADIDSYYNHVLTAWERQQLGPKRGVVVQTSVGGTGAKQLFAHGAIYWRESTGPMQIEPPLWAHYVAHDTENGPLGMPAAPTYFSNVTRPRGVFRELQDFDHGAISYDTENQAAYAIFGALFDVWEKNGREEGPLGMPFEDSSATYTNVTLPGGIKLPILSAAHQSFEGAEIVYSSLAIGGIAGWHANLHSDLTAHVRVIMPVRLGTDSATCTRNIDTSFWGHGTMNQKFRIRMFGGWCGTSDDTIRPLLDLRYSVQGQGNVSIKGFTWTMDRSPGGPPQNVDDDRTKVVVSGSEETLAIGTTLNGADSSSPPQFTDDFMTPDRLTVRNTPIAASDIRF